MMKKKLEDFIKNIDNIEEVMKVENIIATNNGELNHLKRETSVFNEEMVKTGKELEKLEYKAIIYPEDKEIKKRIKTVKKKLDELDKVQKANYDRITEIEARIFDLIQSKNEIIKTGLLDLYSKLDKAWETYTARMRETNLKYRQIMKERKNTELDKENLGILLTQKYNLSI